MPKRRQIFHRENEIGTFELPTKAPRGFGKFENHSKKFGTKYLMKYGWQRGGLGKALQGRNDIVKPGTSTGRKGFGSDVYLDDEDDVEVIDLTENECPNTFYQNKIPHLRSTFVPASANNKDAIKVGSVILFRYIEQRIQGNWAYFWQRKWQ